MAAESTRIDGSAVDADVAAAIGRPGGPTGVAASPASAPPPAAPPHTAPPHAAPPHATPPPAAPPPTPPQHRTAAELHQLASAFAGWLGRPRVRLTLTGTALLLTGGLLSTSSVWTLPLVLIGALMVAIAWIGHRLDGRLAVDWGASGTELTFRAKINAPASADAAPARADVIDGEAHTVEIAVADIKALLAAVETRPEPHISPAPPTDTTPSDATFHVARLRGAGAGAADGPR